MRRRFIAFAIATLLAASAATATVRIAQAADGSLVIAALRVLQQRYVGEVNVIKLLNAAIGSLRKGTSLGPGTIPDIPPDATERDAIDRFNQYFKRAAQAGTVPETQLAYAATKELLAAVHDSHVYYETPAELKEQENAMVGKNSYVGIGVTIKAVKSVDGSSAIFITSVFQGSPAASAGLQPFDRISQVDGKDVLGTSPSQITDSIRGPAGSNVTLTIRRGDQTLSVPITRGTVEVRPVEARFVRPGVAYVKLLRFSTGAADQVRNALQKLASDSQIRAVILDLRGNTGGWAKEEIGVAGLFLPPGTILARVIAKIHPPGERTTQGNPIIPQAPLVVLIDGGTASAAEVVAMGLHNAHRATLVGVKTSGELGGAGTEKLPEGAMSVTVEWVVGPNYEQVERVGIAPDVPVELTTDDLEKGIDAQLDAALKLVGASGHPTWRWRPKVRNLVELRPVLW